MRGHQILNERKYNNSLSLLLYDGNGSGSGAKPTDARELSATTAAMFFYINDDDEHHAICNLTVGR